MRDKLTLCWPLLALSLCLTSCTSTPKPQPDPIIAASKYTAALDALPCTDVPIEEGKPLQVGIDACIYLRARDCRGTELRRGARRDYRTWQHHARYGKHIAGVT